MFEKKDPLVAIKTTFDGGLGLPVGEEIDVPQNVLQNGQGTQESTQEKYSGTQERHSSTQETAFSTQEKILMMLKSEPILTTSEVPHRLGITRDGIRKF